MNYIKFDSLECCPEETSNKTVSQLTSERFQKTKLILSKAGYKTHSSDLGYGVKLKPFKDDQHNVWVSVFLADTTLHNGQQPVQIAVNCYSDPKQIKAKPSIDLLELMDSTEFNKRLRQNMRDICGPHCITQRSYVETRDHHKVTFSFSCFGKLRDKVKEDGTINSKELKRADMTKMLLQGLRITLNEFDEPGLAAIFSTKREGAKNFAKKETSMIEVNGRKGLVTWL